MHHTPMIEVLEVRIAPASIITFTDVDGDLVKVKSTKGDLTGRLELVDSGVGKQLTEIDLASPIFQGTNLIIKVKKGATGDGLVNVGYVNATGVDLGRVSIPGDLGQIDAGDGNSVKPAIKMLNVKSFGGLGTTTQEGENGSGGGGIGALIDLKLIRSFLTGLVSSTGGTADGMLGVAKDQLDSALESGDVLDSSLQRLLTTLGSDIESLLALGADAIHEVSSGLQSLLANLAADVTAILEQVNLNPAALPETLVSLLQTVEGTINSALFPITDALGLGGTINDPLLGLEATINEIVGLLGQEIVNILPDTLLSNLQDAIDGIADPGLGGILGGLGALLDDLLGEESGLSGLVTEITGLLDTLLDGGEISGGLSVLLEGLAELDAGILVAIGNTTDVGLQNLLGTVRTAIGEILALPQSLLNGLLSDLDGVLGSLAGLPGTLPADLQPLIEGIIGVIGDISSGLEDVLTNGGELASTTLRDLALLQSRLVSLLGAAGSELPEDTRLVVKSLVSSVMGVLGTDTDPTDPGEPSEASLQSDIRGDINTLKVARDMSKVFLNVVGNIKNITIGGSLIGGSTENSGEIFTTGDIGKIRIVKHILGGLNLNSGLIQSDGQIKTTSIGGSVIGGIGNSSGELIMQSDAKLIQIRGDLIGNEGLFSASIDSTNGRIGAVKIGGSIVSGSNVDSGSVRVMGDIGSLSVRGSIIGDEDRSVIISAAAAKATNEKTNFAFKRINIGGRAAFASIMGGYDTDLEAINSHAQIGKVQVKGDWIGGNLVAGAVSTTEDTRNFGTEQDAPIEGGVTGTAVSKIASIVIRGTVVGTADDSSDNFGFVAQEIAKFKYGKNKLKLNKGGGNDALVISPTTGHDVAIHELGANFPEPQP